VTTDGNEEGMNSFSLEWMGMRTDMMGTAGG
jgi:hypothetical protein